MLRLKHSGHELYHKPGSRKFYLPICGATQARKLSQLKPNHVGNYELADIDGCPTVCYVLTANAVKSLNHARNFVSFFKILREYLGEGPVKEFFYGLWLKHHNAMVQRRNIWEQHHGGYRVPSSVHNMSLRNAARLSI